jgi:hypothetical protein
MVQLGLVTIPDQGLLIVVTEPLPRQRAKLR